MSAASERSFGEELVRIIRAEIAAYDRRKDEAVRLRKVADQAVAEADRAATNARDSKPGSIGDVISAAFGGDLNAQAIDALFPRQQRSHVNFNVDQRDRGVVFRDPVATDRAQRQQAETAAATASAWKPRGTGENLPRRSWWQRAKS
ncbi:hypothetical protein ONA92_21175 [Mycobacteroides salmoniphilum]|uniref:hypothetical protein n=1 Tax=Mycobacteroides salmoniphilum TaxID=404941 RepID=UPI003566994A